MKEYLAELVRRTPDAGAKRNLAREYLQARILESLQRCGAMIPLAFQGGSALRFLFGLARFSEDLDFSLERPAAGYDLRAYLKAFRSDLSAEGYALAIRISDQRTVQSAFVRFPGLAFDLGFSPHRDETLSIKIEVDTHPPQGAVLETTITRRILTLHLHHHDRASLFAGKLHALLNRKYAKGRDLYDLLWYLSDPGWPEPNLVMLQNALRQTRWTGPVPGPDHWRAMIYQTLTAFNWEQAVADVLPFLEHPSDSRLLTLENLGRLLKQNLD